MTSSRILTPRTLLILVLTLAAGTRLIGLDWSLPHTYEEATPLRVAVQMWGWEDDGRASLNPSFFNYPSLSFYIHFLVQGILFVILKLAGTIASADDWHFIYITDPTAQYVAARLVNAIFGMLTVFVVYRTGKAVAGWRDGCAGALLLATCAFHVARSQMIEVDIPLTFFLTLAAYAFVRIAQRGRKSDYILAGVAIGLAASSKYTGALLVVPLALAHLIAGRDTRSWRWLLASLAVSAAAFALTSPYVFLDWTHFRAALALERDHMREGHFGLGDEPALLFYARSLAMRLVGIPALVLSILGAVHLVRVDRKSALALLGVVLSYAGVILTWSMRADAYAMPVVPVVLCFAGIGLVALGGQVARRFRSPRVRRAAPALLVLAVVAYQTTQIAARRDIAQHDVRTDAQAWLESHVPAGSFIVSENYGPALLEPSFLLQLKPSLRTRVLKQWERRPVYAFTALPMFQSSPELSAAFYDVRLYPEADYIVTTGAIRGRYEKDPVKFASHASFYRAIDRQCRQLVDFGEGGRRVTVYQTVPREPFARRAGVTAPPELAHNTRTGREAGFYFAMGTNYEYFGHPAQAAASYRSALAYGSANPQVIYGSAFGYARCLAGLGRIDEAQAYLRSMHGRIKDRQLNAAIGELLNRMSARR